MHDLQAFWRCEHTEVVHVDNRGCGFVQDTNRSWDMNKDMKGWEVGSRPELLPFDDDDVDEESDE